MSRYKEWLDRAYSSLDVARHRPTELVCYEDLCYQAQQAAEKGLKSLLVFYGTDPPKTHNLHILPKKLEEYTEIPDHIIDVVKLTPYATIKRYPCEYEIMTKNEYEQNLSIAEACLLWIENKLAPYV